MPNNIRDVGVIGGAILFRILTHPNLHYLLVSRTDTLDLDWNV